MDDPTLTPLLDPWAAEVARQEALIDDAALRAFATSFGVHLLSKTPAVGSATISEILDIRVEIEAELVNFRSAMYDASAAFLETDVDDVDGWLADYNVRVIRPALSEIDQSIRANTYISELVESVGDPRDLVATAGGLVIAAATGFGAIGAMIAGAMGLAAPLAKAKKRELARDQEIRSNRLFLLHRLNEPL